MWAGRDKNEELGKAGLSASVVQRLVPADFHETRGFSICTPTPAEFPETREWKHAVAAV